MTDSMLKNILERAIQSEEHSYNLYTHLAGRVERPEAKKLLAGLAEQELKHKELLLSLDLGKAAAFKATKLEGEGLAELMDSAPIDPKASVQDIMLFAIKKEQSACEFYRRMSEFSPNASVKGLFERLAGEELKHKGGLETFYEDMFMREN